MKTEYFTLREVATALVNAKGQVTRAAKVLGCSTATVYGYISRHVELEEVLKNVREETLDHVETKLHERIEKGDPLSIQFYLRTMGRHRGYIFKDELDAKITVPTFEMPKNTGKSGVQR